MAKTPGDQEQTENRSIARGDAPGGAEFDGDEVMSKAVNQFVELIQETHAWLMQNTVRCYCLVCEVEQVHIVKTDSGWKRFKCVDCGYEHSEHLVAKGGMGGAKG